MDVTLPRHREVDIKVTAPPSKSYTHRALFVSALARGGSTVIDPLLSDDTEATVSGLSLLGVHIERVPSGLYVPGCDGEFSAPTGGVIDVGGSGTTARFLTAAGLRARGPFILTGNRRMQERPMAPLVSALNGIGGRISYCSGEGRLPIRVDGEFNGGELEISGKVSSQFISALLIPAPCSDEGLRVYIVDEAVSGSYIDCTLDVMESFGGVCLARDHTLIDIAPGGYTGREFHIEGDYSSAAYFFAIAAVCGGRCTVTNLRPDSPQGDRIFLRALEGMGCTVRPLSDGWRVESTGELTGIELDMRSAPDSVMTLATVAAFAETPTVISGVPHLRYKESDRIHETVNVLESLGARVKADNDRLIIHPAPLRPASIDPRNDHRVAMSGAVAGFGIGGVTIHQAGCVSKSYPEFWEICREAGLL
ncbi:MAG: 3-phosphoshikimate 1-carboxyvinyltransferase [Methanoculleaceae archaeon]